MSPSHSSNDRRYARIAILGAIAGLAACAGEEPIELVYQAVPVETRDIVVSAEVKEARSKMVSVSMGLFSGRRERKP